MNPFQQAWNLLKSGTNRNYPFVQTGPAGNETQYSPIFTGNTIPLVGEGVDRTQTDTSSMGGTPMSSSVRRAREKMNLQQMLRGISAPTDGDEIEQEDKKISGAQLQNTMGLEAEDEDNQMRLGDFGSLTG